jgi:hypothetical protein
MTMKSDNDCRIDYVEFNVADVGRSKKIYGEAFGWYFKDYGPPKLVLAAEEESDHPPTRSPDRANSSSSRMPPHPVRTSPKPQQVVVDRQDRAAKHHPCDGQSILDTGPAWTAMQRRPRFNCRPAETDRQRIIAANLDENTQLLRAELAELGIAEILVAPGNETPLGAQAPGDEAYWPPPKDAADQSRRDEVAAAVMDVAQCGELDLGALHQRAVLLLMNR